MEVIKKYCSQAYKIWYKDSIITFDDILINTLEMYDIVINEAEKIVAIFSSTNKNFIYKGDHKNYCITCYNCIDCVQCMYCYNCTSCKYCNNCFDCTECIDCDKNTTCNNCYASSGLMYCEDCTHCYNSYNLDHCTLVLYSKDSTCCYSCLNTDLSDYCIYCKNSYHCQYSMNLVECYHCMCSIKCKNCQRCILCRDCTNYDRQKSTNILLLSNKFEDDFSRLFDYINIEQYIKNIDKTVSQVLINVYTSIYILIILHWIFEKPRRRKTINSETEECENNNCKRSYYLSFKDILETGSYNSANEEHIVFKTPLKNILLDWLMTLYENNSTDSCCSQMFVLTNNIVNNTINFTNDISNVHDKHTKIFWTCVVRFDDQYLSQMQESVYLEKILLFSKHIFANLLEKSLNGFNTMDINNYRSLVHTC